MKIALVTGANRGLGLETTKKLLDKNFKVYMGVRDTDKAINSFCDKLSLALKEEKVCVVKLDVTKTSDIRNLQNILKENDDILDVLVNNAGVFLESSGPKDTTTSSIFKVDPVIILKTIETNTMGPLKLIQSLYPESLKDDARIINISSGMGALRGMQGHFPGYRMSKTALNALTCIVQDELYSSDISVNSVCPGWVRTDMGGEDASLSVTEGVDSIIWLATTKDVPRGKFIRKRQEIDW